MNINYKRIKNLKNRLVKFILNKIKLILILTGPKDSFDYSTNISKPNPIKQQKPFDLSQFFTQQTITQAFLASSGMPASSLESSSLFQLSQSLNKESGNEKLLFPFGIAPKTVEEELKVNIYYIF